MPMYSTFCALAIHFCSEVLIIKKKPKMEKFMVSQNTMSRILTRCRIIHFASIQ